MAKKQAEYSFPGIELDPTDATPLYQQLYRSIREAVLAGRLRPGEQLPPTREFARQFGISRNTIMLAFECLLDEGYISGRTGAGTFVSDSIPDKYLTITRDSKKSTSPDVAKKRLTQTAQNISGVAIGTNPIPGQLRPFRPGVPEMRGFPFQTWSRIFNKQLRFADWSVLGYGDPAGYRPLRQAIADYLRQARAVQCEPEQVIVVSGSQQALELSATLLLNPRDQAWIEDPGYLGARVAFRRANATLVPIPVDDNGLSVDYGKQHAPHARLVYTTPSHQYPLGVTMSLARRLALLAWAKESGAWIIEDDYDSEYRYTGRPLASLQGLDDSGNVIYVGTFSKVLFPALRLGYMVVPPSLVETFSTGKAIADRGCSTLEQATLAEFISAGHFARHIRKMRLRYHTRQHALCRAAETLLQGAIRIQPSETGLHVVGWLHGMEAEVISSLASEDGVDLPCLSSYCIEHTYGEGLIMGYAGFTKEEIQTSVQKIANLLERLDI